MADLAWTKWRNFDPSTVDDITAVVIDLKILPRSGSLLFTESDVSLGFVT